MRAVIKTGGKQYVVENGTRLNVERIEGEVGNTLDLDQVLLVSDDNDTDVKIGTPLVAGAIVKARIVEQKRGEKLTIFKKRRRQGYRKKKGHRQELTVLQITEINI